MSRLATATSLLAIVLVGGVAQTQPKGDDESAALIDEGRAELKNGALDRAAKALDQAIALNPRRVDAYVLRSAVYAARKQYKEGIALMRRAEALSPNDVDVLTALGSQLVLSGDAATGMPILEAVIARAPERYDAQLLVGLHDHAVGKWPEAIAALEAYFKARPTALAKEDARHRIELADAYLRFHRPQQALGLFQASGTTLRARIGVAWATAALDCKRARPLLKDLELAAEQHPEIWLVDGQCALALGDTNAALAQGKRYLDKLPNGSAAAHALLGEAQAVRGNLVEARRELEQARALEPTRRRWTVRFAHVVRRAGDPVTALIALDKLGPPTTAALDPDWWHEVGEALLAKPDPAAAVARLTPIVGELATDAELRVIFGAAQLATGQPEVAIKTLDEAEGIAPSARGKKLSQEALGTVGAQHLTTNDVAGAEAMLARADAIEGSTPAIMRNLGIARLALGKPADAVPVLDRAAKADPSGIVLMLDARAHALTNDLAGARPIYERALAADKTSDVEVALDWAASELAAGDPTIAVTTLEKAQPKGGGTPRYKTALADARHAAGLVALRAGNGQKAVELLRAASSDNALSTRCDLAVATVAADNPGAAVAALKAVSGQSCPFPPPADVQAAPILVAFTEGLNPRRAAQALDKLTAMAGKSSGAAAALLGTSIRVVALNAAQDAYRTGSLPLVRKYLATARAANARVGNDEVAHNLAVIDLADGKLDAAIAQLERLAPKIPEALVNLGIAYDKKNEPQKALDAWRRAKKLNVRFPPLADWIESKERIYGAEP